MQREFLEDMNRYSGSRFEFEIVLGDGTVCAGLLTHVFKGKDGVVLSITELDGAENQWHHDELAAVRMTARVGGKG